MAYRGLGVRLEALVLNRHGRRRPERGHRSGILVLLRVELERPHLVAEVEQRVPGLGVGQLSVVLIRATAIRRVACRRPARSPRESRVSLACRRLQALLHLALTAVSEVQQGRDVGGGVSN